MFSDIHTNLNSGSSHVSLYFSVHLLHISYNSPGQCAWTSPLLNSVQVTCEGHLPMFSSTTNALRNCYFNLCIYSRTTVPEKLSTPHCKFGLPSVFKVQLVGEKKEVSPFCFSCKLHNAAGWEETRGGLEMYWMYFQHVGWRMIWKNRSWV